MAAVDDRDVNIGVIDEGIGERHAHRTGTYNEVVGVQRLHGGLVLLIAATFVGSRAQLAIGG